MAIEGVIANFGDTIGQYYQLILQELGLFGRFVNVFFLLMVIVVYSVFIWKLYRFIARKDFLELNLNRFNSTGHPFFTKLYTTLFFLIEYILISPFLIFFWFSIFTIFLIVLTESLAVNELLLVSTIVVASIRVTSYYSEDLSKDLAKMLPFTLLAISITNPKFFDAGRIFSQFSEIPVFFNDILFFLVFILSLEILLRFFEFIFSLFGFEDEQHEEKE